MSTSVASGSAGAAPRQRASRLGLSVTPRLSRDVTDRVIVVLKDQPPVGASRGPAAAARSLALASAQGPVVSELRRTDAERVHTYSLVDAISATVTPPEARRLAADPAVAEVIPDVPVRGPDVPGPAASSARGTATNRPTSFPVPPGACPAAGQPAFLGEELELIHAASNSPSEPTAQALGFTGAGVTVAFMADGIDTDNPDFIRPDGTKVFVDYKDFSGDGPDAPTQGGEAFEDASALASQGRTYNVQDYGAVPLAGPCRIKIEGVAPGASLVGLKVFAQSGYSTTSALLQGIDYAVEVDHVNVLNESFGYNPFPTIQSQDIVEEFNDAAVAAGTVVTVAAGDAGPADTLGSPDTDPNIINVGASNNFRFYAETATDGDGPPFSPEGWISDNISGLSSGGFEESGLTDDLVAPGDTSFAACTPRPKTYLDCTTLGDKPSPVEYSGGTSESSPLTAGVAALVIQAYRQTHAGATPTPALVKQILVSTADDLGHPADEQGSGLLDAYRAVLAAESVPAARTGPAVGSQVLLSTGQLHATAAPGTTETWPLTITNVGAGPSTVNLSTRTLGPALDTQDRSVTLSDTGPRFFDNVGLTENYQTTTFTVAPDRDRLAVEITYQAEHPNRFNGNVDVVLIDPDGNFAADAVPQGVGNAAEVEVRFPVAGTWTALIFSATSSHGGTTGPVLFQAQTFDFQPLGTVTPSQVTIPSGASTTVEVAMATPAAPGDESASVVVAGPSGPASSVAVTLRSLVDLSSGGQFSGVLTGGNGRQPDLGQSAYFQFDVPTGESAKTLTADVELADGQTDPVLAYLVDPAGQTVSLATDRLVTSLVGPRISESPTSAVEVATTSPAPGLWTLILNFAPTVTGTTLAEPYSGVVALIDGPASAAQLPDSPTTVLAAGDPVIVPVTVTNTSDAAQDYFIDARLNEQSTLTLVPQSSAELPLPMAATAASPSWLVPADTSEMTLSATAGVPVTFDWGPGIGDPDLGAVTTGDTATGTWSGSPVTSGLWFADPSEIGPYELKGAPPATASLTATVSTESFDPAVTSATGDLWLQAVGPAALGVFTVMPGQSAVIPVMITPSAPSGQVVSGTLYVDELAEVPSSAANALNYQPAQRYFPDGTQVAALPYTYLVG